jgi:hypothetical protein
MMIRRLTLVGLTSVVLCGLFYSPFARAQLKPGDSLGKGNWQAAKGLLPDSVLRRFADGGYQVKIAAFPSTVRWGSKFVAASESNAGKYAVNADDSLIDNATQAYPTFLYGHPFPQIDPKDPHAATKVMYNFTYTLMQPDDADRFSNLHWSTPTALEKYVDFQGQVRFYG